MERYGANGFDRIRVALKICGKKARDVGDGDAYPAVLEIVDDAAGAAAEFVRRSHTVECRGAAPARTAELRNARGGA